jgi:phenylalanyl-tRNA synthetase beta subunit
VHALLRSFGLSLEGEPVAPRRVPVHYRLVAQDHPSFIPGRAAWIVTTAAGKDVVLGLLGELAPEVLVRWDVHFPASGFELRLDPLRALIGAR